MGNELKGIRKMVSDCKLKIGYGGISEARMMAKYHHQRYYHCPHCQRYHLATT